LVARRYSPALASGFICPLVVSLAQAQRRAVKPGTSLTQSAFIRSLQIQILLITRTSHPPFAPCNTLEHVISAMDTSSGSKHFTPPYAPAIKSAGIWTRFLIPFLSPCDPDDRKGFRPFVHDMKGFEPQRYPSISMFNVVSRLEVLDISPK
jgi:hypothetical protein